MKLESPRFFCSGTQYMAPNVYYRFDEEHRGVMVDFNENPQEGFSLAYALYKVCAGEWCETTKDRIDSERAAHRKHNPRLNHKSNSSVST
jgi:hypothetical protein